MPAGENRVTILMRKPISTSAHYHITTLAFPSPHIHRQG